MERFSAAGSIPRNGQRRELAPTARDMAVAHMVEAAVQPLFAPGFASRCQVGRLPDNPLLARHRAAVHSPSKRVFLQCCCAKLSAVLLQRKALCF